VIQKIVLARRCLDRGPVAGTLPRRVGTDDGISRVLFPRTKEMVGAGDTLGVVACSAAAGASGIEEVEASRVVEDVGSLNDSSLPTSLEISEKEIWS
jgi:hypothetical protein